MIDLIEPVGLLNKKHELLHRPANCTADCQFHDGMRNRRQLHACVHDSMHEQGSMHSLQLLSWHVEDEAGAEVIKKISAGYLLAHNSPSALLS